MESELKILLVEDELTDAELIKRELRRNGMVFSDMVVDSEQDFIAAIHSFQPDIILSDYSLPEFDGMLALSIQQEIAPLTPFVLVTGSVNEETAVECMKAGADDYVIKQNLRRLSGAIQAAIEKKKLIAEKKEAESSLRKSEERYRSLFENSAIPIFEEDFSEVKSLFDELRNNGVTNFRSYFDSHPEDIVKCTTLVKITNVNTESLGFFQATSKQELIDDFSACFMDESWPIFKEEIISLAEGNQYFETEIQVATFRWEHRHFLLRLSVRPDCSVTLKQVLVSFVDITARKQAEAALAQSEELFRTAFENATVGVCLVSSSGGFLSVNHALCNMLGYSKEELLALTLNDITLKDDDAIGREEMQKMLEKELSMATYEKRHLHKDGSIRWSNVSMGIVHDSNRRIEYFVTYIEDISERKLAELTIRKSADLYCALTENMKDVIWILDPETLKLLYISPSVEKMVGFKVEEILTFPIERLVAPDYREKLIKDLKKIINDSTSGTEPAGRYHTQIVKQPCRDGGFIWAEITAYSFLNPETRKMELRGVHRDVTERRNAEELMRKSEEKFRLLFEFAADPIQLLDENLHFVDCNESTVSILGARDKSQVLSALPYEISPEYQPDGRLSEEKAEDIVKNAFKNGAFQFEWVHKRFDGTLVTVDINLSKVSIEDKSLLLVHMRDLTSRKIMEEELQKSEEKFRLLAVNSSDVIWTMDIDGRNTYISPSVERLRGYTPEEAISMMESESLTPSSVQLATLWQEKAKEKIFAGEKFDSYNLILEQPCKDNSTVWVEVTVSGIYDKFGKFISFLGVSRDITERKKAEDALRESEEKFRLLATNSTDVIWTMDLMGNYIYVSPSVEKLRGFTAEEVLQQGINGSLTERSLPDALKTFKESYDQIISGKKLGSQNFIFEQTCKDGTSVWTEITMSGIWDEDDKFVSYLGVTRDITQRKKAEELLQEKQFWLTESQRVGKIGSYSLDIVKNAWYSSEVLDEIHGIDPASNKTLDTWLSLIDPSHQDMMKKYLLEEVIGQKNPFNKEYKIRRVSDEKERWLWGLGELIFNDFGVPVKMIGTIQDITDRKLSEGALIMAKEKAEENDRLKTAFLNNISHEIRTPMNAIVGFSGFLNEPNLQPDKRKYFTEIICNASNQLLSIISDIINIATIETGQEYLNRSKFSVNKVLNDICKQFELKANNQMLQLRCFTPLPEYEAKLDTDETKFVQVISNLIGNALKFTKQGAVEFGYTVKNQFLEFYVKDSGIGIPENMHKEIFERFRQADSTIARQYGGTGLGLSISKAYVELMGGEIWLESKPGIGSTFYFNLPFEIARNGNSRKGGSELMQNIETGSTRKILVAEDEDFNFMLLEQILSGRNISLIRVNNGAEAVMACKSNLDIDLVIMDVKMPVMDGYEATRLIKQDRPGLPIIIQTAYARESDRIKAMECGCNEYVSKPIVVSEFLNMLDLLMTREVVH
ncbi:MAG: PAS domain S-box protein [Bacteroidetes bacterium]|nr:PAS domain S-box protein [Bacteroidota bacterium]